MTTKKFPIAITRMINEINDLLPAINESNTYAGTYAGSTMYSYIILDSPIKVKNQFVYIDASKFDHNYSFANRYNVNNRDCDLIGRSALAYELRIILKAFKQCLKNN
jgi:hypothetical protein